MTYEAYICTKADLQMVLDLINQHQYIYGVDIKSAGILDKQIDFVTRTLTEGSDIHIIVGVRDGDKLVSFCAMGFWEIIPAWSPIFLCESADLLFPNRTQQELKFSLALQKCISIAESKNIYTGFFVTRYSHTWKRTHESIKKNFIDYIVSEVEVLPPNIGSKYTGFKRLLGEMNGINQKSIAIIQFSKSMIHYK